MAGASLPPGRPEAGPGCPAMTAAHVARAGATPQPNLANLSAYLEIGARFDHDAIEIGLSGDYHAYYSAALASRTAR